MNNVIMKIKENKEQIVLAVVFGCFPLICALVYSLLDGHSISDVYLPASYWNDELFYFKQVEAVVNYGLPQGWFGFQEMHGSVYPFAAWSPAVLIPYIIWGCLFGWGFMSPIYANIVYNMIAMVAFALLVRPGRKQSFFMLLLLAAFAPYSRYLLSSMPETIYMSMGIWLAALAISQSRVDRTWKLVAMFFICILITLARPYLILLMALPAWLLIRKKRGTGAVISLIIAAATAAGYFVITNLCSSPYFIPLIETDWLNSMIDEGFMAGIKTMYQIVREKLRLLITHHLYRGFQYGLLSGALHAVAGTIAFLLGARVLCLQGLKVWKKGERADYLGEKREKECDFWLIHFVITAGMLAAIFLFYPIADGAKHWMIFIVVGIVWIALLKERFYVMKIVTLLLCAYLFVVKAFAPFDWQVPYDDGTMRAEAEELGSQLEENMVLAESEDRFDNTVIWLASDMVNGESISAPWGYLYMIPKGFGINFCFQDYVMTNLEQLHSAYIAVMPGGDVDKALLERKAAVVGEVEHMKVYRLR
ncbi:MAG: hypothetical protein IKV27_00690 [Lachnospiraceae bacterium]|nr:hypothetical protein [Lachnospiraceae bacterium]